MGIFDQLSKAAKEAKKALDESGVLDEVADVVQDLASSSTKAAEAEADQPSQEAPPDVPAGVVDPATLLTVDDLEEIAGVRFTDQYPFRDEEWIGTIFSSTGPESRYFELRVAKAPDYEEYDPDAMWEFLVTEVSPQEPVDGLTPGAFRSAPDTIFFRVGDQVLHTVGNLGDRTAELAEELARRAIARLR